MRYDDPFKDIRDLNRQLNQVRELTRNPLEDMDRIVRERQAFFRGLLGALSETLKQAEVYRRLSFEAAGLLPRLEELSAHRSAEISRAGLELGRAWAQRQASLIEEIDLSAIARQAVARTGASIESPLLALQDSLQTEVLKAANLSASIPALRVEEQVGILRHKLETPAIASTLDGFREAISQLQPDIAWPVNLIGRLGEVADLLDLPHLGNAALQWSIMLEESVGVALGSMPLLELTLSGIADSARHLSHEDLENFVERWERIVETERTRHPDRRLPPGAAALLLNVLSLLLSLLGLAYQCSGSRELTERLDQIEESQESAVQALQEDEANEEDAREARAEELTTIRIALADLAASQEDESKGELQLRIASEVLRLRAYATFDSKVITLIPKGFPVEVVDESEGWCRVRVMDYAIGELVDGWVAAEFLQDWPEAGQGSSYHE